MSKQRVSTMNSILLIVHRPLRRFSGVLRDRRGAAAVLLAVALSGIVGFAGLGSEVASWYYTTRAMQGAADSAAATAAAALSSATATGATITGDQLRNAGRSVAATFNFANGTNSTTVTVNNPPATTTNLTGCSSPFTGFNCYVEVLISQPQTPLLTSVFMSTGPTIAARSVAFANTSVTADGCIVALDKTSGHNGISLSGSPTLTLTGCALIDNSSLANGGTITAKSAYVSGSISGSTPTTTDGTFTGTNPMPDPYLNLAVPSYTHGNCDQGNSSNGTKITGNKVRAYIPSGSTPYIFCQGLQVQGGSTAILCPGTYIMDRGTLDLLGGGILVAPPTATTVPPMSAALCGADLTGGVTIVLTNSSSTTGPPANISIGANSTSTFTAPTSGSLSGIALFQDRMACASNNCGDSLGGGAAQNLTGVMYFPSNIVTYNGGASTGGSVCTKLIAYQITFSGNPNFFSNCSSAGTKTISYTNGQLVM
jgi:Flp pilus assembly protein TadG